MSTSVYFVGGSGALQGSPAIQDATCTPGDVLVLLDLGNYASSDQQITAVQGLGATWSKIPGAQSQVSAIWVGQNPTQGSGPITTTAPALPSTTRRFIVTYGVGGATSTTAPYVSVMASGGTATVGPLDISSGQAIVAAGYSDTQDQALTVTPVGGWGSLGSYQIYSNRYGGYGAFAPQAAESVTAKAYRASAITSVVAVVVGDPDGSTPPPPSLKVSMWEGGQRVSLDETSFLAGSGEVPLSLSGIYETRAAVDYFDPAPVLAGIDAATTVQGLEDALSPLMAHSVATVNIAESPTSQGGYTARATSFSEPRLKPFLRYMVESLARIDAGKITGSDPIGITVCDSITDGSREVSGVAFSTSMTTFLSVNQTPFHYETTGSGDEKAHPGLLMHELAHLVEFGSKDDYYTAFTAMHTNLQAANPPGFSYGQAVSEEPFTGEHPLGFPRKYGRVSRVEDFADMVAYMTVPALYTDLRRWMQSDPYLVKKHAVVKDFLAAIGWGEYAIEEMHGHVPQVHPL